MDSTVLERGLYGALALSAAIAVVAIGLAVAGCGADGGCAVVGTVIGVRHLGAVTAASGLFISAVALSGRVGTKGRPIDRTRIARRRGR
jgi:hypothetical protein